jgi:hypothetical protein
MDGCDGDRRMACGEFPLPALSSLLLCHTVASQFFGAKVHAL